MEELTAVNHEERLELADLLTKHRAEVERRWLDQVASQLNRRGISETELRNSIPDYLLSIADQLREEDEQTTIEQGIDAWASVAREHAVTRIRMGFDVDQVMEEFMLLR